MIAALTGIGLATSAGLNAFIPLLTIGLLARLTDLVSLPGGWGWLGNGWVLALLGLMLIIDVVADKVPAIDHLNDVLQTAIRPTSGGIVFSAGMGSTTAAVTDPSAFVGTRAFGVFVIGVLLALAVHVVKATVRAVINLTTSGAGAPIVSTLEEAAALATSVAALLLPLLVIAILLALVLAGVWARRRWSRSRARRRAGSGGPLRDQRRLP